MKSKQTKRSSKNDTTQKKEDDEYLFRNFFKRIQKENPTMTLDEIGDAMFNTFLYKRKIRIPKK